MAGVEVSGKHGKGKRWGQVRCSRGKGGGRGRGSRDKRWDRVEVAARVKRVVRVEVAGARSGAG